MPAVARLEDDLRDLFAHYSAHRTDRAHDEALDGEGGLRPHWRGLMDWARRAGPDGAGGGRRDVEEIPAGRFGVRFCVGHEAVPLRVFVASPAVLADARLAPRSGWRDEMPTVLPGMGKTDPEPDYRPPSSRSRDR